MSGRRDGGPVRAAVALLVLLVSLVVPAGRLDADQGGSFTVVDLRGADGRPVGLADPEVIRVGDTWYLYGTSSPDGFEVWSSPDLTTWTYGGLAWVPEPGSWAAGGNRFYWAPDVWEAPDGAIWMYYTANQRIGVARADSPLGPFVDQLAHPLVGNGYGGVGDGVLTGGDGLVENFDDKAIDAHLFEDVDGSLYLYLSLPSPFSSIGVLPMDDPITPGVGAPIDLVPWEDNLETWEWFVREGPIVVEHEGTFHLMYSGHDFATTCYAVGVATGPTPLGPFTRRADNPILATDLDAGIYGPGHHSVAEDGNGGLLAVFHVKTSPEDGNDRVTGWSPLGFDADGEVEIRTGAATRGVDPSCIRRAEPTTTTTAPTSIPPTTTTSGTSAPSRPAVPATPIPEAARFAG